MWWHGVMKMRAIHSMRQVCLASRQRKAYPNLREEDLAGRDPKVKPSFQIDSRLEKSAHGYVFLHWRWLRLAPGDQGVEVKRMLQTAEHFAASPNPLCFCNCATPAGATQLTAGEG